ncbi:dynein regulatory complex subunit 7 [Ischnura elegans]|uniref:dynein regulatory complex subunit 7 n=1 Tax=Ischnura elegans TaxID=197161 RepID=UPI001ED868C0|nr:dynein regulatory complex subunit 7 [Ischnura elegans]
MSVDEGRRSTQTEQLDIPSTLGDDDGGKELEGEEELDTSSNEIPGAEEVKDVTIVNITIEHLKEVAFESGLIHLTWPLEGRAESDTFPESYCSNNNKEKLLLWYAENFRRQYHFVHIERKPLLLAVENECGVQKMVCTAIRPTMLPYPEFYTWQGCANFVADHITYKPLERFTSIPRSLFSPWAVVKEQQGHCFEMSTLLVSYLVGAGFEAYVVYGYATFEVCSNNQSRTSCPMLAPKEEEVETSEEKKEPKYAVEPPKDLRSKYILEMEARELRKIEEEKQQALEEEMKRIEELEKPPLDDLYGRRVHSWVLVLQAGADAPPPFFIEPSTGVRHELSSPFYLGLESIWDHQNYWVNLQQCTAGCRDLEFNLSDTEKWEHLLVAEPWILKKGEGVKMEDSGDGEDMKLAYKHLDMPVSWSLKPSINHLDYEKRYPGGTKTIFYKKAKMESFAPYHQSDGVVTRITTYEDYDWTECEWIYEYYSNRMDKLFYKTHNVKTESITESFEEGRDDALKEHTYVLNGNSVENFHKLNFYNKSRYDCLEVITLEPLQLTEEFKDRTDYLYYRKAEYGHKVRIAGSNQQNEPSRRPVTKIVECYHRNWSKSASHDIARVEYAILERKIKIKYHYEEGKTTAATREFSKPEVGDTVFSPEMTKGYKGDLELPREKQLDLYYLLNCMLKEEEKTRRHIREVVDEMAALLKQRMNENTSPNLKVSVFDLERNQQARDDLKEKELQKIEDSAREVEADIDHLAPFLARLGDPSTLTVEQAWTIRSDCLADCRQRLSDQESRMASEWESRQSAFLAEKKWFEENEEGLTKEKKEKYLSKFEKEKFYLLTLGLRLARHRHLYLSRIKKLEILLDKDPRLSILF